jgi:rhodanese-related sulfurtransferase/DNA-binding transcriptional ArsR family regulator
LVDHRPFKDRLYAEFALIGKALANPHRLELLDLLGQAERSVDELAQEIGQSLANTSAHLQVLRQARLVEAEKRGLNQVYRLAAPDVYSLWRTLRDLGTARLAEVDRIVQTYLTDRTSLAAIDLNELERLVADGSVTLLDVRPRVEYEQGHIPDARSIPVEELEHRLADLPRDRDIVAYCRGPYCVFSDEAAVLLQSHGFRVLRGRFSRVARRGSTHCRDRRFTQIEHPGGLTHAHPPLRRHRPGQQRLPGDLRD